MTRRAGLPVSAMKGAQLHAPQAQETTTLLAATNSGAGSRPAEPPTEPLNELADEVPVEDTRDVRLRRDPLTWVAALMGAAGVVGMMCLVVFDVTARFLANAPLSGTIEYVAYWLMLPATAFGIVVAYRRGDHVDVPLLVDRLGAAGRLRMRLLSAVLFIALTAALTWFGALGAWERLGPGETAGASQVAIGATRWFLPVAMGLLSMQLLTDLWRTARALRALRPASSGHRRAREAVVPVLTVVLLAVSAFLLHQPLLPEAKGSVTLALMLVLLLARVPVAVAMAVPGLLATWGLAGAMPLAGTMVEVPFTTAASWSLSVLPMFIFMGLLLWRSGATRRLYEASRLWLGWLPGGLAVTTTVSGAGLAAASGSTVGITHALARIGLPEMLKSGYDRRIALGSVLMSGMAGQLIPPSVLLVVYAGVAQVPVGPQLVAGVLPGILLATTICLALVVWCTVRPSLAPRTRTREPWGFRVRALLAALPVPALSLLVIGGLLNGVFTATEAGAFGCLGAFLIAVLMLRSPSGIVRETSSALVTTVASVGQIMFLIVGTALLTRAVALSGLPVLLVEKVNALGVGRLTFLLLLVVLYLALGAFLDPIAMMLLTVPFLLPVMGSLDIDLIWFGVFVVLLAELGMVTPPVGLLVFIVHKLAQNPSVRGATEIRLSHAFTAASWMLPVALLVVLVLIAFPGVVTLVTAG
jgi:C4-dicarboxylate transporter, DctM subunit